MVAWEMQYRKSDPVAAPLKGTGKAGLAFLFLNEALAKVKFRCK